MSDEPHPPQRPRRVALDLLLMVGAMIALGALLAQGALLAFDAIDSIPLWGGWGLLTLAQLLLAASLMARLRQR